MNIERRPEEAGGKIAEKEAEKASFPGPEPSREEQLEAQVAALQSQVDALLGVSE